MAGGLKSVPVRRRISGTVKSIGSCGLGVRVGAQVRLRAGGNGGEEGQREHGKGDGAVPGGPVADLVVVQADLAFCGLEARFDAPPAPGDANQRGQGHLTR
ncbi:MULTISPECIES: hypothetical protein [unclassified Streptomyces]|uniref:hypothetical protein n=1 Tax=unclassified Streptomyces TaxID=2593676 RepID=UPI004041DB5D